MTNYEKSEYYRLMCEAWQIFYQGFTKPTNAILNCRGILMDMQSEIIKAGISNPNNKKIEASQNRIDMLNENLDVLESLNNKCAQQQKLLKEYKEKVLRMEAELEEIKRQEREGLTL